MPSVLPALYGLLFVSRYLRTLDSSESSVTVFDFFNAEDSVLVAACFFAIAKFKIWNVLLTCSRNAERGNRAY